MSPATLLGIARRLEISKSSVSVALSGRPGVSETLRAKIVAEARRVGYRPNPAAAELMALVRSKRAGKDTGTIAFVDTFMEPGQLQAVPAFRDFIAGARERAEAAGYRFEEFQAFGGGMKPARLGRVLKARGIRGVLVGPRHLNEPDIAFDWDAFSCVLVGETRYGPNLYRVCNHHVQSCAMALLRLADLGYRRIGVVLHESYEAVRGFDFLMGVEEARVTLGDRVKLFALRVSEWNTEPFLRWAKTHRLDAVLSHFHQAHDARKALTARGKPVAFASLSLPPGVDWAGVEQYPREIGRAAMDMLRGLLHAGERGVSSQARILLIEGTWVDGATAPARPR